MKFRIILTERVRHATHNPTSEGYIARVLECMTACFQHHVPRAVTKMEHYFQPLSPLGRNICKNKQCHKAHETLSFGF